MGKGATGLTGIYRRRIPINRGNHRVYGKGLSKTLATDYKTGDFRERAERAGTACRRQASRGPVFCRGLTAAPVSPPGVIHLGGTINRSRCLHLGRKQGARSGRGLCSQTRRKNQKERNAHRKCSLPMEYSQKESIVHLG